MLNCGTEGKVLDLIKSMYSKVKSCVRSNSGLTDLSLYKRGLRQGCLLSPLLFALFLNDLNDIILLRYERITLWGTYLFALLYADDLILITESRKDLQSQMNGLGMYVDKIKMDINEKKTKV